MSEFKEIGDSIYRQRVNRAQSQTLQQRIEAGFRVFQRARSLMICGIRHEFPQATDAEVWRILEQRLALSRRIHSKPMRTEAKHVVD